MTHGEYSEDKISRKVRYVNPSYTCTVDMTNDGAVALGTHSIVGDAPVVMIVLNENPCSVWQTFLLLSPLSNRPRTGSDQIGNRLMVRATWNDL